MKELLGWPKNDANWILVIEFSLMMAFFLMNSSDLVLMERGSWIWRHNLHILEKRTMVRSILTGAILFYELLVLLKALFIFFCFPKYMVCKSQERKFINSCASVTNDKANDGTKCRSLMLAAPADADPNAVPINSGK
ncbi:hypothetical protein FQR65_LT18620 [Abscondita terminalis]|nr:hypothetical protein FQR65_LT18620 [Abscondita terminalis]